MPNSKKKNESILASATAGMSTISVTFLQYNPMNYNPELIKAFSACCPILSGAIVGLFYWLFLTGNGETIEQKTLNNKFDRQIKRLRQQIKQNRKDKICTSDLEKTLNSTIQAQTELYN